VPLPAVRCILLPHVHTESKLYRVVRDLSGLKLVYVVDAPCVNWPELKNAGLLQIPQSQNRTNLNRRRRRLAELGKVTFETITGAERCAPVMIGVTTQTSLAATYGKNQ